MTHVTEEVEVPRLPALGVHSSHLGNLGHDTQRIVIVRYLTTQELHRII